MRQDVPAYLGPEPVARPDDVERVRRALATGMRRGVLSFPLTAFTDQGELHLGAYRSHLERQLTALPGALFVCCGTGEFYSLDEHEFEACVRAAVETAASRVPVIAGAGYGWPQATRFCRIAENAGADGILLMPPYLVTGPQEGIVAHVREVASRTSLPLVVYQRGQVALTVESVSQIAGLPNVIGLKDAYGNLERVVQERITAPRDWLFFNGTSTAEMQAAAYKAIGVPAYSSAVHAFAPEIAKAYFDALHAGDEAVTGLLLRDFYGPFVRLRDRCEGYAVSLIKAAARIRGQDVGPVRAPLTDPDSDDKETLTRLVKTGLELVHAPQDHDA